MRNYFHTRGYLAGFVAALLLAGCIVSATFVITEKITFTAFSGFYYYQIDITTDATWQDHKDEIDFIDAVGAEFYITSTEASTVTFSVYVDTYDTSGADPTAVPATATKIINDFSVAPGKTKISYAQSLGILTGIDRLKALAKTGKFDYYATSTGNEGNTFVIDSAIIVVTLSASK